MNIKAIPAPVTRPRVHVERTTPNVSVGTMLGQFIGSLILGTVQNLFAEGKPSPRYEGHFGADETGKRYDQMTKAEHEEAARWWGYG